MNYDIFRLNARKFDLIFGFVLMFGSPLLITGNDLAAHPWFTGIFGIAIYLLEAWAFVFKVSVVRVRALQNSSRKYWPVDGELPELPAIIFVGRFLRGALRVLILVVALFALLKAAGIDQSPHADRFKLLLVAGIAFEGWIYARVRISNKETKRDKAAEYESKEYEWRNAHLETLKDRNLWWKEMAADYLLLITAIMFTQSYWHTNWEFYQDLTDKVYAKHLSPVMLMITMSFGVLITALVIVLPARLAYYVEEKWNTDSETASFRKKWSLAFAVLCTVLPFYGYVIYKYYL